MQRVRMVLIGLGNLGRRFCQLLSDKDALLRQRYDLDLLLVAAADSRGAAYAPAGLDLTRVAALKTAGDTIGRYPGCGRLGWRALELIETAEADLLLEASPVNLGSGAEPGLSCIRCALQRGLHVVTPNKGPLVTAFAELTELAAARGVALRYDGTVAGGLPAVNLGQRDLRGAEVLRIEAVPNLVTGLIMDRLAAGVPRAEALAEARAEGTLEADASWDLDGWDAAAKLAILVNATCAPHPAITLADVERVGIEAVDTTELRRAWQSGERYRLLARAERSANGTLALSVAPTRIPLGHPLGRLGSKEMGVVFETDIYGRITAIIEEPDPVSSAATMLRDILDIYAS